MDALIIIILVGFIMALALPGRTVNQQPPQIIYVQNDTPQSTGVGCLPIILIAVIALLILALNS